MILDLFDKRENHVFNKLLNIIATWLYKSSLRLGRQSQKSSQHRIWSNNELARFSKLYRGSVCNVSGWDDSVRDGTLRKYREYFPYCESYTITNYPGQRGCSRIENDPYRTPLDITKPLPEGLEAKFDVVFNHTTLEHVYEMESAAKVLSGMSKDMLIIIVPFIQEEHFENGSYYDYWRFTPRALCELFQKYGFTPLYVSTNDFQPWYPIYIFYIGTKYPSRWKSQFNFDLEKFFGQKTGSGNWYW